MLLNQVVLALAVTGLCIAVPTAADLDDVTAKRTESNATIPYANEDPKAMPLGAFTWSGPLVPGGPVTSFEAKSAEDAYHRLREMISGYDAAMFAVSSKREVSDNKAFSVLDRLQKRDNWKVDCWTDFAADADRIREGEDYLHRIHGNCALRPWVCSRVSCSWDAGITFCNTNAEARAHGHGQRNNPLSIPCSSIGDLSALIRQECHRNPFRGYYYDLDFPFQVHDEWQSC